VLELKVVRPRQAPETALASAVAQLKDRRYHTEVRAAGAGSVFQYAVVFDGKRCWVEAVPEV
jgi:stage V sporulation protein SpoVS